MSTAKRSRRRQPDARAASPLPASKRIKTTKTSHVPARHGLDFLVDDDAKQGKRLEAKLTNGVSKSATNRVDESRAAVAPNVPDKDQVGASQQNAIDISSVEDSSSDESVDEDGPAAVAGGGANGMAEGKQMVNGHGSEREEDDDAADEAVGGAEDVDMDDEAEDINGEAEEPSFGELLQARHPDPIDVQASFPDPLMDRQALATTSGDRTLGAPSGTTLRTVLTQALKTNDRELLERCFQTSNLNDIRATIERLQSQHVTTLLQRLAERIHKRPGRTGNLITWVQWSLVAHGAYLASQPQVMRKLKSLEQVLRERANGLQPLLRLKGKLDMLQAQLELRQRMRAASRAASVGEDDDEEGVVYVEGQGDDFSDSEDAAEGGQPGGSTLEPPIPKFKGLIANPRSDIAESSDESESDDDLPNGVAQEGEDGVSEDDDAEEGMFDIEAEETSDEASEDENDVPSAAESDDESDSSASEEITVQQPKPSKLNRKR
ncbi:Small subunit (SSU) processome component [Saxophila tyrrhenica]|uniref:Small subunit (SSU) processome component n=1 Tax=Saxophila tyrrhenica TaxID=1690608 RepID=A0AAV9PM05_9PEZI|nr:Small subunit (SSU) processome component [Saxophila tyrrhenica]